MDSLARDSSFTSILSILLSSFLRPRKASLSTAPFLIDYKIATRSLSLSRHRWIIRWGLKRWFITTRLLRGRGGGPPLCPDQVDFHEIDNPEGTRERAPSSFRRLIGRHVKCRSIFLESLRDSGDIPTFYRDVNVSSDTHPVEARARFECKSTHAGNCSFRHVRGRGRGRKGVRTEGKARNDDWSCESRVFARRRKLVGGWKRIRLTFGHPE